MAASSALSVNDTTPSSGRTENHAGIKMPDVTIDDRELKALMTSIQVASMGNEKILTKMFKKIGSIVGGKARAFAPRSMTKSEYKSTLVSGETDRDASSFTTGNLKKSITVEVNADSVEIGVPSNSPAGKYAEKMHDEHGKTWNNLGWQNDAKATHLYIFKAYEKSKGEITKELNNMLGQIIKKIVRGK